MHPRLEVAAGGHHDDGYARGLPDLPAHLEAVLVGQAQVEQDDVGAVAQLFQRLLAGAGAGHLEAVPGQDRAEGGHDPVVVLDHQQSHRPHLPQPPVARA